MNRQTYKLDKTHIGKKYVIEVEPDKAKEILNKIDNSMFTSSETNWPKGFIDKHRTWRFANLGKAQTKENIYEAIYFDLSTVQYIWIRYEIHDITKVTRLSLF